MQRAALLSVSDRTGIEELAKALKRHGFTLLTTSGTGKSLKESGIDSLSIEKYTGQPEILDGRVKTLHPKVYAGLLAKRDNPKHMQELAASEIMPIDFAAINLYRFEEALKSEKSKVPHAMVEFVDIGGPTMIRAAAKNHLSVAAVIDPNDYAGVIELLDKNQLFGPQGLEFRRALATKVFSFTANYDLKIASYFSAVTDNAQANEVSLDEFPPIAGVILKREQPLRYGENPNQKAAYYRAYDNQPRRWRQLSGKELSYNNILDTDAGARLVASFVNGAPFVAIIKHLNPCGAAIAETIFAAFNQAKRSDPRSYFGGIIACNGEVTVEMAQEIRKEFFEIVIAPRFSRDALDVLKGSPSLRIIETELTRSIRPEIRSVEDGILIQDPDPGPSPISEARLVSDRTPTHSELLDLDLAWKLCAHVKSNAIVLVREGTLIGAGAGQTSRIDAVEVAISKAKTHGHDLTKGNVVAASDAFFPFPDNIEALSQNGVSSIITPGGAKRDEDVIKAAKERGVTLLFTNDRHFRH